MKKLNKSLVLFFAVLMLVSCGTTVKLKDSWKSETFDDVKGQKILVLNRGKHEGVRQRGERTIADELRSLGLDAVEGFVAFPNMVEKDRTQEEIDTLIKNVLDAGYETVVVTRLRNQDEAKSTSTRLTEQSQPAGKLGESEKYYETSEYGKYPLSFGVYYNSPDNLIPTKTPGPSELEETTTNYTEIYRLETVTYDLSNASQLKGVVSINVSDPESLTEVLEKYATLVAKQFK
ncbi:hypothetical protein [Urechidicola sp. KH5]